MKKPFVLFGAGGHAKVVLDVLVALDYPVIGVFDPRFANDSAKKWRGIPVLGADESQLSLAPTEVNLALGIGLLPRSFVRQNLFTRWQQAGFSFPTLVHPAAVLGSNVNLGVGVQVMAGAVIQADTVIADNCIINTGAIVDHDCVIGAHSHVAPSATLCGGVSVGEMSYIASGSSIIQGVVLPPHTVVAAGATVVKSIAVATTLYGTPAKPLAQSQESNQCKNGNLP